MGLLKNFKYYRSSAWISLSTFIMGIYLSMHINYLDDPRVTPFPPPVQYRALLGFVDDNWFTELVVIASLVALLGIAINKLKLIVPSMLMIGAIFFVLAIEFGIRGVLQTHTNLTWVVCLCVFGIIYQNMFNLGKGGERNR